MPVLGPGVNPRIYIDLASCLVSHLVQGDVLDEPYVAQQKEEEFLEERDRKFLEERERRKFDLQLMSPLNDVSGIRREGRDLIIVAAVNNVLHFRIFDGDGEVRSTLLGSIFAFLFRVNGRVSLTDLL